MLISDQNNIITEQQSDIRQVKRLVTEYLIKARIKVFLHILGISNSDNIAF